MENLLTRRNTLVLVGAVALWHLYLSAQLQLHPDEAYYWLWSRYLDASYFDHPPMVAYFIRISTLLSQSELWVRLSGSAVLLLLSGLMWRLSLEIFKSVPVAAGSVMLFNVLPLTMLGLLVITPDVPVLLFWSLGVYLFWRIMDGGRAWLWYPLGVVFGLALLSKYTAILMVPCFFLYLVLTDERRWLRTVYPYLALGVGLLCFSPVLLWNSRHEWVSFTFQFRNGLGGQKLDVLNVGEYLAGQLLLSGPLVWVLGMYGAAVGLYRRDKPTLLLVCTAAPVILFFAFSSLRKVAGPNWPAFAYFSLAILFTHYCLQGSSKVRRALWSVSLLSSLALSLTATLHAQFHVLPLGRVSSELAAADATNAFHGWRELGAELKKYPGQLVAISPSHQLSAEIIYYTGAGVSAQVSRASRPSQFNLLDPPHESPGKDRLYVWTEADFPDLDWARIAASAFRTYREGQVMRTYHVVSGQAAYVPPSLQN